MNLFRRGVRRKRLSIVAFAGTLLAYQALALIGAGSAAAAALPAGWSCTYASGVLTVTATAAGNIGFQVSGDGSTRILLGAFPLAAADTTLVRCPGATADATVASTTSIQVIGDSASVQGVAIEMYKLPVAPALTGNTTSWGTINWTISLGSDTGSPGDVLEISNRGATPDPANSINVTLGANGIDLNSDLNLDATASGVDTTEVFGGPTGDTIWGEGDITTGGPYTGKLVADGGDDLSPTETVDCDVAEGDTISGGAADDVLSGGADTFAGGPCNEDFVDYSAATGPASVNLTTGVATAAGLGIDTLCIAVAGSCAVTGPDLATIGVDGDGNSFEDIGGSKNNDTLTGDDGAFGNDISPGAGDDTVDGKGGGTDYIDFLDSAAGVTVDMPGQKATGDGNDTFSHIEGVVGSDFDDDITDDNTSANAYYGEGGADIFHMGVDPRTGGVSNSDYINGGTDIDTVDYSERADNLLVCLYQVAIPTPPATSSDPCLVSAVTGGNSGDQDITPVESSLIKNVENANLGSGDDVFFGNAFNNAVKPGGGQNVLDGLGGSDTLDYLDYEAGVEVNMAGGSTAGDSATAFENVIGSDFADTITGNESSNTIKSHKGNDNVRAGGGDDTVKAGAGKDRVRGSSGDDDLWGQKGNDYLNGGSGDDFCKGGPGKDTIVKCEGGHK